MRGESEDKAPDGTSSAGPPSPAPDVRPRAGLLRRRNLYLIAVGAIVVVVVSAAYVLTDGFQRPQTNSLVLVHEGTPYVIPGGQFDGIPFEIQTTSVINGTFVNSFGIVVYTMNSSQYLRYAKTNVIPGYEWTSGIIANESIYNLDLTVLPGSWALVFVNPSPTSPTAIGFYSDLTLAPS